MNIYLQIQWQIYVKYLWVYGSESFLIMLLGLWLNFWFMIKKKSTSRVYLPKPEFNKEENMYYKSELFEHVVLFQFSNSLYHYFLYNFMVLLDAKNYQSLIFHYLFKHLSLCVENFLKLLLWILRIFLQMSWCSFSSLLDSMYCDINQTWVFH